MSVGSEQVEEDSGQRAEICSLIQEPAEKSKEQTHRPQREWDENLLGTGKEYTELVTQEVIDFTGDKDL